MIRPATASDIDALVAMGEKFHAASGIGDLIPFEAESFRITAAALIRNPFGIVLVIDHDGIPVGMAGAAVYPAWFNVRARLAQEVFWWVDPEARGTAARDLMAMLIREKRLLGANASIMVALDGMRAEAVARLYRREGYRPMERSFVKGL